MVSPAASSRDMLHRNTTPAGIRRRAGRNEACAGRQHTLATERCQAPAADVPDGGAVPDRRRR